MRLIVLLSAYNGEPYIREQLDSLFAQTLDGVEILVRDDGSIDGTRAILAEYAQRGALRWYADENLGPACSFWLLLQDAPSAIRTTSGTWVSWKSQPQCWNKCFSLYCPKSNMRARK